jgi:hypothetical protein
MNEPQRRFALRARTDSRAAPDAEVGAPTSVAATFARSLSDSAHADG